MKSAVYLAALLFFIGVVAVPTNAFARVQHHHKAQTHLVSAKKSHKASKTSAHRKVKKKKADGVPS